MYDGLMSLRPGTKSENMALVDNKQKPSGGLYSFLFYERIVFSVNRLTVTIYTTAYFVSLYYCFVLSYIPQVYPLARSKIMYFYANNYLFGQFLGAISVVRTLCTVHGLSICIVLRIFQSPVP